MDKNLTICLLTYARTDYALNTLRSALDNLRYSGPLSVHIADDGSKSEHRDSLLALAGGYTHVVGITKTNSEQGGYGRNFNLASQVIHGFADYVLPLEDDWAISEPLDLDPLVRALDSSIGIECIRLGYLSFTQALHGRIMSAPPEWFKYLLLDPASAEPHVWAGHPRLETVSYQKRVGPWVEGLAPGATEFTVAHWPSAREGVAWPLDLGGPTKGIFSHIGTVRSTDL